MARRNLHDTDRTLTIIQDLHKAGHIEFKDSELDYCDFMDKEDGIKLMHKELDPFQKAIDQFVNS